MLEFKPTILFCLLSSVSWFMTTIFGVLLQTKRRTPVMVLIVVPLLHESWNSSSQATDRLGKTPQNSQTAHVVSSSLMPSNQVHIKKIIIMKNVWSVWTFIYILYVW